MITMPLGDDSLSDDPETRAGFLLGRVVACMSLLLNGYRVPPPEEYVDPTLGHIVTNTHTGRRYRVNVVEIDDGDDQHQL